MHHLLSDLERDYFYMLEFSDCVLDIREQFPLLSQETTLEIADELRIKHPIDTETKFPIVLTTDFLLIIRRDGETVLARN